MQTLDIEIDVELLIHAVEQLWDLSDPAYANMRYICNVFASDDANFFQEKNEIWVCCSSSENSVSFIGTFSSSCSGSPLN